MIQRLPPRKARCQEKRKSREVLEEKFAIVIEGLKSRQHR